MKQLKLFPNNKKIKDVKLKIKKEHLENILKLSGYIPWWTIRNNEKKDGYIKNIDYRTRFHLHYIEEQGKIFIHIDKAFKGYHRVVNYCDQLRGEKKYIKSIYKDVNKQVVN